MISSPCYNKKDSQRLERRDDAPHARRAQQQGHRVVQHARALTVFVHEPIVIHKVQRLTIIIFEVVRLCVARGSRAMRLVVSLWFDSR